MKIDEDALLSDLPPLDGDGDEPLSNPGEDEDDLVPMPVDDAPPLDDAASDNLADEELPDSSLEEGSWRIEEAEVDVGEEEIDTENEEAGQTADGEESGIEDNDVDLDEDVLGAAGADEGEEGTTDHLEDALLGELPDMDADEEGDFEDDSLIERGMVEIGVALVDEAELPRWADVAWERRLTSPSLAALPTSGFAVSEGKVFAACERVLEIAPGRMDGRVLPLFGLEGSDVVSVAAASRDARILVLSTSTGGVYVSRDGGQAAIRAKHWPTAGAYVADPARAERDDKRVLVAIAADASLLWARAPSGQLFESRDLGRSWQGPVVGRSIRSVIVDGAGRGVALSADDEGAELFLQDGYRWVGRPLTGEAAKVARGAEVALAASGQVLALASRGGVVISRNDGATWTRVPACGRTTALVLAGDAASAPLVLVVFQEDEGKSYLIRVGIEGVPEVVAEIGPEILGLLDDDVDLAGLIISSAWDASRSVVWLGGQFGLLAWGPGGEASKIDAETRREVGAFG